MHFKNKVVWITGASSGIGKELALQLAQQGAILILTGTNVETLTAIKSELKNARTHILNYNLLDIDGIPNLVDQAMLLEGHLDYVIQSAGQSQRAMAEETDIFVYKK